MAQRKYHSRKDCPKKIKWWTFTLWLCFEFKRSSNRLQSISRKCTLRDLSAKILKLSSGRAVGSDFVFHANDVFLSNPEIISGMTWCTHTGFVHAKVTLIAWELSIWGRGDAKLIQMPAAAITKSVCFRKIWTYTFLMEKAASRFLLRIVLVFIRSHFSIEFPSFKMYKM